MDFHTDNLPPFNRCKYQDAFFGGEPPLGKPVGYAVVLGLGLFFSVLTTFLVFINKKFGSQAPITSERFKYVAYR
jgi:hypothetical protein